MKKLITMAVSAFCMGCILFSCKKNFYTGENTAISSNAYSKTAKGDTIIHNLKINGRTQTILEIKGEFYISDDMLIHRPQFEALKRQALSAATPRALVTTVGEGISVVDSNNNTYGGTWPDGIVYFKYPEPGVKYKDDVVTLLTDAQYAVFKSTIDIAMAEITDSTGIIFRKIPDTSARKDFMQFWRASGNSANVGYYRTFTNPVRIHNYSTKNTIMHEIMHGLGVYHEHQRPDRDNFISINWDLVQNSYINAFKVQTFVNKASVGDLDFESIMFYSRGIGCIDGGNCITRIGGGLIPRAEDKPGLSKGDAAALRQLYPTAAARKLNGTYRIQSTTDISKYLYTNSTGNFLANEQTGSLATKQHYQFIREDINVYRIKPVDQVGKVLAFNGKNNVLIFDNVSNASDNQKFKLYWQHGMTLKMIPVADTTLRLEFSASGVRPRDASTDSQQTIKLIKLY